MEENKLKALEKDYSMKNFKAKHIMNEELKKKDLIDNILQQERRIKENQNAKMQTI